MKKLKIMSKELKKFEKSSKAKKSISIFFNQNFLNKTKKEFFFQKTENKKGENVQKVNKSNVNCKSKWKWKWKCNGVTEM